MVEYEAFWKQRSNGIFFSGFLKRLYLKEGHQNFSDTFQFWGTLVGLHLWLKIGLQVLAAVPDIMNDKKNAKKWKFPIPKLEVGLQ